MTSFTIPITYDRNVLVIPRPGQSDTLQDQVVKVLEPFTYELWGLLVASIFFTALLAVWFKDKTIDKNRMQLSSVQDRREAFQNYSGGAAPGVKRRANAYFRLLVDEFISKGLFFFSAGVEQDEDARYEHVILSYFAVIMPNSSRLMPLLKSAAQNHVVRLWLLNSDCSFRVRR